VAITKFYKRKTQILVPKIGCFSQNFCTCLLPQHPRQTITGSPHLSGVSIKSVGDTGHAVAKLVEAQDGRLQFRFPMVILEFFIDLILSATLWPWGRLSV